MHLLSRNIGCWFSPDVSALRYRASVLSLQIAKIQHAAVSQRMGKWLVLMKLQGSILAVMVVHMAQVLTLHECQTGLTLPGCLQILSVSKPNL